MYTVKHQDVPQVQLTSKQKLSFCICSKYRVTIQHVMNLPLTSKQKFPFGLARLGQAKTELLF